MQYDYTVAVIGGGPGGYAAAGRAAQLGMKTVLIERESLGGICLNWGCIPTKALLESAHTWKQMLSAKEYGLLCPEPAVDFPAVIRRSRQVADRMSKGVAFLMKQRGVTVIDGHGTLTRAHSIQVEKDGVKNDVSAEHIVIATGGRPIALPGVPFDGESILHYRHAMTLETIPKSLAVIGAGAIGMEFADFYRSFGSEVTVIEMLPTVLPNEDEEIITELMRALRRKKITIHTGTKVTHVEKTVAGVTIDAEGPKGAVRIEAEKLLVAVGTRPNSENLGLEALGVHIDRGLIRVDDAKKTDGDGIYAIGDVIGAPMLAHKASMDALICINAIAGHPVPPRQPIPGCTYIHPQVASVGLTEKAAVAAGYSVKKGLFPFRANGRSIAMNETDGLVKLVFDASNDRLIGAHIIHVSASDLIAEAGLALNLNATARSLAETVHAHPTLSEAIMEAAASVLGEAIHI